MATYYLSESGNDIHDGITLTTPWKTISKVNAMWSSGGFHPSDNILFKRGETFPGKILASTSGTTNNEILLGSYGTGDLPIITGFAQVTQWDALGENLYQTSYPIPNAPTSVEMLTLNGVQFGKGRYPKLGSGQNNGYLLLQAASTSTSIIGLPTELNSALVNWTGATVLVRPRAWQTERRIITSHTAQTLTWSGAITDPTTNFGYFFLNPVSLAQRKLVLSAHGDWHYDLTTHKVLIYLEQAPNNYTIQIATQDLLIDLNHQQFITVDGLAIQGSNGGGLSYRGATHMVVRNCDVGFCGFAGIDANSSSNTDFLLENNQVHDCNDVGIDVRGNFHRKTVQNNEVWNIALHVGMGNTGSNHFIGIYSNGGTTSLFKNNHVHHIGYAGMKLNGDELLAEENLVHDYCLTTDDTGGIYTGDQNMLYAGHKIIAHNLVWNGVGAGAGAGGVNRASGIYLDDGSQNFEVHHNSVWDVGKYGIYMHNAKQVDVHDNYLYNAPDGLAQFTQDNGNYWELSAIKFHHNVCYGKTSTQYCAKFWSWRGTHSAWANNPQDIDNNFYLNPFSSNIIDAYLYLGSNNPNGTQIHLPHHTLEEWQIYSHWDVSSQVSPLPPEIENNLLFLVNSTDAPLVTILTSSYRDAWGKPFFPGTHVTPPRSICVLRPSLDTPPPSHIQKIVTRQGKLVVRGGHLVQQNFSRHDN